jgi:hypothetical protein
MKIYSVAVASLAFLVLMQLLSKPFVSAREININTQQQPTELVEDNLNPSSMSWGGGELPREAATDIKDALVGTPVGRVVIDRNTFGGGIPELGPFPGTGVLITVWGSKIEGCFVEAFYQLAPAGTSVNMDSVTPTLLEIGVGGQAIELPPQQLTASRSFVRNYTYIRNNIRYGAQWGMTRNLFRMDATIANILANAPTGRVRGRLTLASGERIIFSIDEATVASWRQVYAFNPTCVSPQIAQSQQQLADRPLVNACRAYRNQAAQIAALNWLQSQVPQQLRAEFARRWRVSTQVNVRPVTLVEACSTYKNVRSQNVALDWLQGKLTAEALNSFIGQWQ